MSAAFNLALLGIAITAFFGLGGVDRTKGFIDDIKGSETVSKIIDNTKTTTIPNANGNQTVPTPQPKQQEDTARIQLITAPKTFTRPTVNIIPDARVEASRPKQERKDTRIQREKNIPDNIKFSTSLSGSKLAIGEQLKRDEDFVITNATKLNPNTTSRFQQKVIDEQKRAEQIFASLFGNVSNPNFSSGGRN